MKKILIIFTLIFLGCFKSVSQTIQFNSEVNVKLDSSFVPFDQKEKLQYFETLSNRKFKSYGRQPMTPGKTFKYGRMIITIDTLTYSELLPTLEKRKASQEELVSLAPGFKFESKSVTLFNRRVLVSKYSAEYADVMNFVTENSQKKGGVRGSISFLEADREQAVKALEYIVSHSSQK